MSTGYKVLAVILGILMIASGIYCLCTPGLTFLAVGWIIGFNMVADAIGNIFTWKGRKELGMADGWTLTGAIISLLESHATSLADTSLQKNESVVNDKKELRVSLGHFVLLGLIWEGDGMINQEKRDRTRAMLKNALIELCDEKSCYDITIWDRTTCCGRSSMSIWRQAAV